MRKSESFLYQEIAESVRRRIASGDFQPGDKLPSVRNMAQRWSCTPGTVSRAYAQLTREGLVFGQRGGGTRVTSNTLQPERPNWQWATLVNDAERFLLHALQSGHTPAQIESALSLAVARWRDLQQKDLSRERPERGAGSTELRFAGSHDLSVEVLARLLRENTVGAQFTIEHVGSLGGLMALAQNKADVAGVHLWDAKTDTYNTPFVRRLFPDKKIALLTLAHRSLGLITPPGNPQGLNNVADLVHPQVCLVNRQSGSGTRVWLDAQLKAHGIPMESVQGYHREESTHLAVARAVEQGEATVGLGIHAAAAACGLGFVPLTQERYDLAFTQTKWNLPTAQKLVQVIHSTRFKEAVNAIGGYDVSETGQTRWVS